MHKKKCDLDIKSATLLRRVSAFVYDTLIVFSLVILATALALLVNKGNSFQSTQYLFLSYLYITCTFFTAWLWQKNGQTLGMLSWKIKVVDNENQLLTWRKALIRCFIALPCVLTGLSWFWCLIDKDKQSLHDRICQTKVIKL